MPEVLESLREDCFPQFRTVYPIAPWEIESVRIWEILHGHHLRFPQYVPLRESLENWSARWSLTDLWCMETAILTMDQWGRIPPEETRRLDWTVPGWGGILPLSDEEQEFSFYHPGWDPIGTSWQAFERDLDQAYAAAKAAYRTRVTKISVDRGYVRVRDHRQPLDHLDWLVKYQILGKSYTQISVEAFKERQTIRDGVRRMAALIDLQLRPDNPPGRPRQPETAV